MRLKQRKKGNSIIYERRMGCPYVLVVAKGFIRTILLSDNILKENRKYSDIKKI